MINIVLFGAPGSGKGTQAENLVKQFSLKHISTGNLFRYNLKNKTELGKIARSFMDQGKLVPDEITSSMLSKEVKCNLDAIGFVFDGYPRTINQAIYLDEFLSSLNSLVLITISLKVSDKILISRLLERAKTSGRPDDINPQIIQNRIKEYYEKTSKVANFYKEQNKFIEIKGVGSINDITKIISKKINKFL